MPPQKVIEIEVDQTHVLYPDAKDVETVVNKKRGYEYTMGLLPSGRHCVKSITYKAGYRTSVLLAGRAVHTLKESEKMLDSIWGN